MVVCKFFAQGWCRFGNNCRFEHVKPGRQDSNRDWHERDSNSDQNYRYNQYGNNRYNVLNENRGQSFSNANKRGDHDKENLQNVIHDIECWEYGNQWLFTCYLPAKDGENFPGFNDVSPEELRWHAYQAQEQGTLDKYKQQVAQLTADVNNKRQKLKSLAPPILDILHKIFNGVKLDPSSFPESNSNVFDSTTGVSSSTFSFKLPATSTVATNQPLFSNNNQAFGNSENTLNSPFSSFGSGENQGRNIFGGNPTISSNIVAQSSFHTQQQTQSSPFQTQQSHTIPAIPFQTSHTNASTFSFAPKLPESSAGSAFGTTNSQSSKEQKSSLQSFSFTSNPSNLFGVKSPQSIANESSIKYSLVDILTEEEKSQYIAVNFTLGLVPEKPPMKEWCS